MKFKIILLILIVAIVGIGGFWGYKFFIQDREFVLDFYFPSEIDLYFSDLNMATLPNFDLGDNMQFEKLDIAIEGVRDLGETPVPEISVNSSAFNFSFPTMNISEMFLQMKKPSGNKENQSPLEGQWSPNASDCAGFSMAPSCSFVPAEHQEMCQKCKEAGF